MGHLDGAAGVTGLIKTVLALEHEYPAERCTSRHPNPKIDFDHSPFYVCAQSRAWKTTARCAGRG